MQTKMPPTKLTKMHHRALTYVVMAYRVTAYRVMAYPVMAGTVGVHIVMAYKDSCDL